MLGIAARCFEMAIWSNSKPNLKRCDIVIEPTGIHQYNIFQFTKYQELFDIGYNTTKRAIPEIKAKLERKMLSSLNPPGGDLPRRAN
jgi:NTE family protein